MCRSQTTRSGRRASIDVDGALGVVGLADDVEAVAELGAQPGAHDGMVVGEHDADDRRWLAAHLAEDHNRTSVPLPGELRTSARPPIESMPGGDRLGQRRVRR